MNSDTSPVVLAANRADKRMYFVMEFSSPHLSAIGSAVIAYMQQVQDNKKAFERLDNKTDRSVYFGHGTQTRNL